MITAEEARQKIYKELDKDQRYLKLIKDIDGVIEQALKDKKFLTEFHPGRMIPHSHLQGILHHYKSLGYSVKVLNNWERKTCYLSIRWYEEEC